MRNDHIFSSFHWMTGNRCQCFKEITLYSFRCSFYPPSIHYNLVFCICVVDLKVIFVNQRNHKISTSYIVYRVPQNHPPSLGSWPWLTVATRWAGVLTGIWKGMVLKSGSSGPVVEIEFFFEITPPSRNLATWLDGDCCGYRICIHICIYIYLEAHWPFFLKVNPSKAKA